MSRASREAGRALMRVGNGAGRDKSRPYSAAPAQRTAGIADGVVGFVVGFSSVGGTDEIAGGGLLVIGQGSIGVDKIGLSDKWPFVVGKSHVGGADLVSG